jgi:hypothetical protein
MTETSIDELKTDLAMAPKPIVTGAADENTQDNRVRRTN